MQEGVKEEVVSSHPNPEVPLAPEMKRRRRWRPEAETGRGTDAPESVVNKAEAVTLCPS